MYADLISFFHDQLAGHGDRHAGAVPRSHRAAAGGRGLHDLRRSQGLGLDPAPPRVPNVVGPFGLLQPFADGLKLVLKETIVPSSANGILFIIAPMIAFMDRAGRLGGRALRQRLGHRRHQRRHPLSLRDLVAGASTASSSRAGPRTPSTRSSAALRSAAQMVSYEVSIRLRADHSPAMRRLAQPVAGRARPVRLVLELVLAAAAADVRDLLHLRPRGDEPHAV